MPSPALRTGSLRTRTVLSVLALLTVLLVALGFTVQLVLGDRLRSQLEDRLRDRASAAAALIGTVSNDDLASRLSAQGVSVLIRSPDGGSVVAGPSPDELRRGPDAAGLGPLGAPTPLTPAGAGGASGSTGSSSSSGATGTTGGSTSSTGATRPGTAATPGTAPTPGTAATSITASSILTSDAQIVTLESELSDGSTLTLTADASQVEQTVEQLRLILVGASAAFLLAASAALVLVVRRSLSPLESMTALARDIAHGDRGRRLRPTRPGTEIGRVADAFDEMLDGVEGAEGAARAAEARVRSFVSDAAHELRTPVAGMQAAADTLVRASLDRSERERLAAHVVREAARASRLIDDMLMMARVDQGLVLERMPIDLGALVDAEVERQRIRRPQLDLEASSPPDSVTVEADAERLRQVVANLVDNAARMTGGIGPVRIAVSAVHGSARIWVTDQGPGVPAPDRERIFDRLVRLDSARNASGGGAGLGLPIARGIMRSHGGDLVSADPVPGLGGAVFLGTLPLAAASGGGPTVGGGAQDGGTGSR